MKKLFPLMLAAVLSISLFTGCATTPGGDRDYTPAVKQAAYLGTFFVLREHPEWREKFEAAANQLEAIAAAERLDFSLVLAIVGTLPVTELKSDDAKIIITSAQLLLADYGGGPAVSLEHSAQTRAIVGALATGIRAGLK
jgi:hypothetical protein